MRICKCGYAESDRAHESRFSVYIFQKQITSATSSGLPGPLSGYLLLFRSLKGTKHHPGPLSYNHSTPSTVIQSLSVGLDIKSTFNVTMFSQRKVFMSTTLQKILQMSFSQHFWVINLATRWRFIEGCSIFCGNSNELVPSTTDQQLSHFRDLLLLTV